MTGTLYVVLIAPNVLHSIKKLLCSALRTSGSGFTFYNQGLAVYMPKYTAAPEVMNVAGVFDNGRFTSHIPPENQLTSEAMYVFHISPAMYKYMVRVIKSLPTKLLGSITNNVFTPLSPRSLLPVLIPHSRM